MADVWDKLDAYTKSDYLNSSDEEDGESLVVKQTNKSAINTENSLANKDCLNGDNEAEQSGDLHNNLLNEMRESRLHCDTESRNVQEKIDELSSEKKKQKEEPSEMHHKAQVISKCARMSATEVLSNITSSETMNIEDNCQMGEYLNKIRSVPTESNGSSKEPTENDAGPNSLTSDIDLPDIPAVSTVLNTGIMKSRVNVARQGSMKARRKPTHRKSLTAGIDKAIVQEKKETDTNAENTGDSNIWVLPQTTGNSTEQRSGSCTSSESSSEDEKEVTKPNFFKSGVALPGLWDVEKIQLQRSELKRPTALTLVKSAKDAREHEVTKEDKPEVVASKPDWMKEVEKRKKNSNATRRKHMTLPGRCSELEKLFEQRKNENVPAGRDIPQVSQDDGGIASEVRRPNIQYDNAIDPQLSKLLEKRRNLKPMEDIATEKESSPRPKSMYLEEIKPSELDKIFEKRKALRPLEDTTAGAESGRIVFPKPKISTSFQDGDRPASGIVRAKIRDSNGKLEPLPVSGQVHVAKISEVRSEDNHRARSRQGTHAQVNQIVQFTHDGEGGSRAVAGRIQQSTIQSTSPQSNQEQVSQVGQVCHQISHDGGSRAVVGRIPTGNQKSTSRLGHNDEGNFMPMGTKYKDQLFSERAAEHSRSKQGELSLVKANRSPKLVTEQLSGKPGKNEQGKSRKNRHSIKTFDSIDTTDGARHVFTKTIHHPDNQYNSPTTFSYGEAHLPSNTQPPQTYPKTYLPNPYKLDHTLPPLHLGRGYPPTGARSPGLNTPESEYFENNLDHEKISNRMTNTKGYYTPPVRLRSVGAPSDHGRQADPFLSIENKLSPNQTFENGLHGNKVKNPVGSYSSPGSIDNQQINNQPNPVTVTVKSITESPVRVKVRDNGVSHGLVTNGNINKRTGKTSKVANRNSNPQRPQSPGSDIPKWKQELKEKKRLAGERQNKTSHDKENIKTESPESDVAEWQKRLKGIRRKWGDADSTVKDRNDNFKEVNSPDKECDSDAEPPGFLKEFQEKKIKQKNKVTVTAKSTASRQSKDNGNGDHKSSSKHELGTYV